MQMNRLDLIIEILLTFQKSHPQASTKSRCIKFTDVTLRGIKINYLPTSTGADGETKSGKLTS